MITEAAMNMKPFKRKKRGRSQSCWSGEQPPITSKKKCSDASCKDAHLGPVVQKPVKS